MGYQKIESYECDKSGIGTGPVEDECADDAGEALREDPLRLPVGWIQISIGIKLPNPERAEEEQAQQEAIAQRYQALLNAAAQSGQPIVSPEEQQNLLTMVSDEIQAQRPLETPPVVVRELDLHYHPDHVYDALLLLSSFAADPAEAFPSYCEELGLPVPEGWEQALGYQPEPVQQQPQVQPVAPPPAPAPVPVLPQRQPAPQVQPQVAQQAPQVQPQVQMRPQVQPQVQPRPTPAPAPPPEADPADPFTQGRARPIPDAPIRPAGTGTPVQVVQPAAPAQPAPPPAAPPRTDPFANSPLNRLRRS